MKNKKISLAELKVKSFVTQLNEDASIKGGNTLDKFFTEQSCMDYVSCHAIQCAATRDGDLVNCNL